MPITKENIRNVRRMVPSDQRLHINRLKATTPRTTVINLFRKSRIPLCVEDIQTRLPDIKLSTLYRVLKLLEEKEMITRTSAPAIENKVVGIRKRTFYEFR